VPSEANEQAGSPEKSGKPWVARPFVPLVIGGGIAMLFYGALYRFPLINGIDSPFFYPLTGAGFVATIAAIVWRWGRREVLKKPYTWISWVVGILMITLVVAVGVGGAFATWGLFVTLNGALDFGPAAQRSYTVVEYHQDCGGDTRDRSYYLLESHGAQGGGKGPLRARASCSDDEGLPVDGGGAVPVGSEVLVEIKPGAFGEPWQAGYRAG
jgi:hypothetical protein